MVPMSEAEMINAFMTGRERGEFPKYRFKPNPWEYRRVWKGELAQVALDEFEKRFLWEPKDWRERGTTKREGGPLKAAYFYRGRIVATWDVIRSRVVVDGAFETRFDTFFQCLPDWAEEYGLDFNAALPLYYGPILGGNEV
jgi:hypothetical protein